jgi:hypothetical protein
VVPNRDLYEAIRARDLEVHLLGDCSDLSYIEGSILDGARIGRAI